MSNQEGHGVTIAIARVVTTCPVKAVKAWLQAAGISDMARAIQRQAPHTFCVQSLESWKRKPLNKP
jgi:hypothetical protein